MNDSGVKDKDKANYLVPILLRKGPSLQLAVLPRRRQENPEVPRVL